MANESGRRSGTTVGSGDTSQSTTQPREGIEHIKVGDLEADIDTRLAAEKYAKIRRGSLKGGMISKKMFERARAAAGPNWKEDALAELNNEDPSTMVNKK